MPASVSTAVLPAAGLGTRLLPATKAVPKEMLPIVDRPTIQYVVEESVRAGLEDILLITARGKSALEDHFDRDGALEDALTGKGKYELLKQVRSLAELASIHTVRQPQPLGLGHAVLQAREHVGGRAFAVLLGDDLIEARDPLLERMIEAHQDTGRPVVALLEVPRDEISAYGAATATPVDGRPGWFSVSGLVEKPPPEEAPSNLAVIGRYVLPPEVFGVLERTEPGRGGEIQLTDALQTMAAEEEIVGVRLDGMRHDAGDKLGYLKAIVHTAAAREDLGGPFLAWLEEFLDTATTA